jgi:uncharacterized protein YbjT (DUF2867 family)
MEDGRNGGRLILVSGATGQQGGAVARSLLGRGIGVRALTRDPEKPEAKELVDLGAEVASGDLEDRSSIERVLDGVHGVFSVQQSWETGVEGEIRQGVLLADAAKAAGVDHYVYSSVGSAHRETGIPHFESKWEVEEHVRGSGVPYTVLRPVFFMQNWEFWDQFEEQMGEEYTVMYRWFDEHGYEADIAALKEEHPGLVAFEQYLRANGWENAGSSPEG